MTFLILSLITLPPPLLFPIPPYTFLPVSSLFTVISHVFYYQLIVFFHSPALPSKCGITGMCHHTWFDVMLEMEHRTSCMLVKHCTVSDTNPSLDYCAFVCIHLFCMYMCGHAWVERTAFRSQFSPCMRFQASNSGQQAWEQVLLPTELCSYSLMFLYEDSWLKHSAYIPKENVGL